MNFIDELDYLDEIERVKQLAKEYHFTKHDKDILKNVAGLELDFDKVDPYLAKQILLYHTYVEKAKDSSLLSEDISSNLTIARELFLKIYSIDSSVGKTIRKYFLKQKNSDDVHLKKFRP